MATTSTFAADLNHFVAADCPAGTRVIGGGASTDPFGLLTTSVPFTEGWFASAHNDSLDQAWSVTAVALCAHVQS